MKAYINQLIEEAVAQVSTQEAREVLGVSNFDVSTPEPQYGDYATNAAMVLFKRFNQAPAKNPAEFASVLAEHLTKLDQKNTFSKIEPAGGFINFTVAQSALAENALNILQEILIEQFGSGKKVVFEYSSPNTNKALHIGHVRNNVYGKACINLLRATGHQVISSEIINDRGIHIMKSILMYQKYGQGKTPESEGMKPDHFVGKYYAMFGQKSTESEAVEAKLLAEAQELLQRWEAGDEEVRTIWKQMNDWFYEGAQATYAKEGTTFDEVNFESEIYDKGKELVMQGVEQGIFAQEPDGSVSIDLEEQGLGKKYLLRSDGTTLYITQDMYLWDLRNKKHNPDMAIVTTASEQAYHFKVLAHIFALLNYDWANNFKHLPYEHVFLGKSKMSSRSGNTVTADELLDSVKQKVKAVMSDVAHGKGSTTDEQLVEQVAFAAIKYGYLQYEPNTRIYFDIDSTIALQGNTGPYIQYAYARIHNILDKVNLEEVAAPDNLTLPEENLLLRKLLHYPEVVSLATRTYKPNLLCNYLYELASVFGTFYNEVSVKGETDQKLQKQRATLLKATAKILQHGLALLGIEAPERM